MPTVRKSAIVERPAEAMFALVDAVEHYPEFLPWCMATELIERTDLTTHARLHVDYHGLKTEFATVNRKQAPEWMHLDFTAGPFERFHGHWRFVALGDEVIVYPGVHLADEVAVYPRLRLPFGISVPAGTELAGPADVLNHL